MIIFLLLAAVIATPAMAVTSLDCTSSFSWEPVSGEDATVQFTNLSTGSFNTWLWDFGDGFTSGIYHPSHTYSETGIYYVCLTVSDGLNCYDTYCDTVVVVPVCEADFNFTYVPTSPPLVQFTDQSTGFPDTWYWDFGDGSTSTQQNPAHAYEQPGSYEVCLTIVNNDPIYPCIDTVCKTVIIPDSTNCEADYMYSIDEDNPLKVHFTDLSTGDIAEWEWNFGDGHTSVGQNPVHIFSQAGEYLVCLKVENDDTAAYCIHFICKTIILTDSVECLAGFSAMADSSSQSMYRYFFYDESSGNPDHWSWDFGDGHTSDAQHPSHTYSGPGTYQVCLNAWNSNIPGCNDSHCILVQTADYFQLGGMAFAGGNPINNPYPTGDTGIAVLYRQRGPYDFVAVDTSTFHELGYYWFSYMMEMGYMIHVSLSPQSEHYAGYAPSYFPGVMRWQEADVFTLDDNMFEMHTSLTAVEGTQAGHGRISGRVVADRSISFDTRSSYRDIPVILGTTSGAPLAWISTDEYGQFEFRDIAYGTYTLFADKAGVWSQPENVSISESFPVIDTVSIKMYDYSPFAISEPVDEASSIVRVYPNPASDVLHIDIFAGLDVQATIRVINTLGQPALEQNHLIEKGNHTIRLSLSGLQPGIYLLNLQWPGQKQTVTKKFIKK